ncbi:MAG: thioredoxin domain-containing protein [Ignavibacteriales bacterium]|nr:thioredoxin domain-containing protein [Ignavibacteriales bacterium]
MTLGTLRKMALSGMYDHVGGGFHRYATDREWHVPHFEKMLYDQAQLVVSFLEAFQIMQDRFYADVAVDVLEYIEREMSHPDGGWYSAQDAESGINAELPTQKKEGAFYTWTYKEAKGLLTDEEFRLITKTYDVQEGGNVLSDLHGEFSGLNILHIPHPFEQAADAVGVSRDAARSLLASAKLKLRTARMRRPAPHRDDNILVSWNGLMISAFARASQALANPAYRESAAKAARFILSVMKQKGHLVRRYRDGEARFDAHLDDYAFLAQGLIDLYEASFDIRWLREAFNLADELIRRMYDDKNGGFYDTGNLDPTILVRTKEFYDSAEPTGNSVAILTLLRLTSFLGRTEYETRARSSLQYFAGRMKQAPSAMPQFLVAYDFSSSKPKQIILAGEPNHTDTQRLVTEIHRRFIPNKIVLAVSSENRGFLESMVPFVKTVQPIGGKATAYVCEDFACKLPTTDPKVLAGLLDEGGQINRSSN